MSLDQFSSLILVRATYLNPPKHGKSQMIPPLGFGPAGLIFTYHVV